MFTLSQPMVSKVGGFFPCLCDLGRVCRKQREAQPCAVRGAGESLSPFPRRTRHGRLFPGMVCWNKHNLLRKHFPGVCEYSDKQP